MKRHRENTIIYWPRIEALKSSFPHSPEIILPTPQLQISKLMRQYCSNHFKPLSLWHFVIRALINQHRFCFEEVEYSYNKYLKMYTCFGIGYTEGGRVLRHTIERT